MRFDSTCDVCGSGEFREFAKRADGIPVLLCAVCGHGVVREFPDDVGALYGDNYFSSADAGVSGYQDYENMAEHGVAWAAALIRLLRPGGRVLDIGCADGRLLSKLGGEYERAGIEQNRKFASLCRERGIDVIAHDLMDAAVLRDYRGSFDVVSAIAVFEHLPDFRAAIEVAIALLRPEGVLLFEVPMIREDNTDDVWLRTSLEHIHYPTERSVRHLFESVLHVELTGSAVSIREFGHTFVGIASKDHEVARRVAKCWPQWTAAPAAELSRDEARFRWLFEVIHAAHSDSEALTIYRQLDAEDFNPALMARVVSLLADAERRTVSLRGYLAEVEKARDWHARSRNESAAPASLITRIVSKVKSGLTRHDPAWKN